MALDFLDVQTKTGAVIYMIHDGSEAGENEMTLLAQDVAKKTKKSIVFLDKDSYDAHKLLDFYHLKGNKFVLVVQEDAQINHVWSGRDQLRADEIALTAERAG